MADKKKVVVVGGGIAGSIIANRLQNVADVTLVDPKDYFEIPYAELRCIVEPVVAERSLVLHKDYLKTGRHVQSVAKTATASAIITNSGETIPYDYLAITTGTTFNLLQGKITKAERLQEFKELNQQLLEAESVLIIGGGPVGVELAGEIVTDFPKKTVTLVHSGDRVLEFPGSKVSKKTQKWLTDKGVTIILNDRVENLYSLSPPKYETAKHVEIEADMFFVAVGKKVGIKWIEESPFLKEQVSVDGRLQVAPTCQVIGFKNVFAAGDVTDFKEIKQGYLAGLHSAVIVENIKKLIKNPDDKKLKVYEVLETTLGIVSLGRVNGVAQLPFGTIIGRMAGTLKSKDLFITNSRTYLGLKGGADHNNAHPGGPVAHAPDSQGSSRSEQGLGNYLGGSGSSAESQGPSTSEEDVIIQLQGLAHRFTYSQLSAATGGFSEESELGRGGFGSVYRGMLPSGLVAVKRMNRGTTHNQGMKEFKGEVSIICQLRQRNLIELIGWREDLAEKEYLLVYELEV